MPAPAPESEPAIVKALQILVFINRHRSKACKELRCQAGSFSGEFLGCSGPRNVIGNEPFCAAAVYFLLHSEPFVSYRKDGLDKNSNFYAANSHHFCS